MVKKFTFLAIGFLLSLGLALLLALWQGNPTTKIPEISINGLLLWGMPLIPTFIVQAGHHLTQKQYPDGIYMRLFSVFWFVFAFAQVLDKMY